jgi:hypothetical protein
MSSGIHPALSNPVLSNEDLHDILLSISKILYAVESTIDLFVKNYQNVNTRISNLEERQVALETKIDNEFVSSITPVMDMPVLED